MAKDLTTCHTINIYEIALPLHAFHQSASKSNSWAELHESLVFYMQVYDKTKPGSKLVSGAAMNRTPASG